MKLTTLKKSVATVTTLAIAMTGLAFAAAPAAHASIGCSVLEGAPQSFTAVPGVDWNIQMSAGDTVTATWSNLSGVTTANVDLRESDGLIGDDEVAQIAEMISPGETVVLSHVLSTDTAGFSTVLTGEYGQSADVTLSCVQAPVGANQFITFDAFPDSFTTVANVELTATASSGLPVSYVTTTPDVCGITTSGGTSSVLVNTAGTCTITASQPGGMSGGIEYLPTANFEGNVSRALTITKAAPYIEFTTVTDQLLSAGTVTVDATADVTTPSGITTVGAVESFTSLTTEVCTVQAPLAASATVNLLDVGTCTIQADRAADARYLAVSDTISFTISNAVSPPVDAGSQNLPAGLVGFPYSTSVTTSGGKAPFYWSIVSGTLPTGLSLNSGNGVISGTPTTEETQTVTIRITDSRPASQGGAQRVQVAYTLTILEELVVTTPALEPAVLGQGYSQTLQAEGGDGNYTWTIDSGTLPAGLSLSTSGVISGTPTELSTNTFTIRVTDGSGVSGTRNLPTVVASSTNTTIAPVQTRSGSLFRSMGSYDINLGGTCVSGDCSYGSVSGGGTYSFTNPGVYVLVITTTDSNGLTTVETYTITVLGADGEVPLETVSSPSVPGGGSGNNNSGGGNSSPAPSNNNNNNSGGGNSSPAPSNNNNSGGGNSSPAPSNNNNSGDSGSAKTPADPRGAAPVIIQLDEIKKVKAVKAQTFKKFSSRIKSKDRRDLKKWGKENTKAKNTVLVTVGYAGFNAKNDRNINAISENRAKNTAKSVLNNPKKSTFLAAGTTPAQLKKLLGKKKAKKIFKKGGNRVAIVMAVTLE